MHYLALLIVLLCWNSSSHAQPQRLFSVEPMPDSATNSKKKSEVAAAFAFQFDKTSSLDNLVPAVFYGYEEPIKKDRASLRFGPSVSSRGNVADSTTFLRAMMLPGNAAVGIDLNLSPPINKKTLGIFPKWSNNSESKLQGKIRFGVEIKALSGFDSSGAIIQHNVHGGMALKFADKLFVGILYTTAAHDLTSDSETNFQQAFHPRQQTDLQYMSITTQFVTTADVVIDLTLHSMLNGKDFGPDLKTKYLALGIGKSLSF